MSSYPYIRSQFGARDGLALIMVLAFIVLLTILIVSFVSFTRLNHLSTASYSRSIQAQEIAHGGIQDILGDLHQEIAAGSNTNATTYASSGGPMIYVPTTNLTAVPARVGYAANLYTNDVIAGYLPPSLIRVSRASQDTTPTHFYPNFTANAYYDPTAIGNLINRASAANSSTNSFNGRFIAANRWNKINLLSTNSTLPAPFSTNTPDWIYVTRTGSRVCQASEIASLKPSNNLAKNYGTISPGSNPPASPVVGRYAFAVYDEGALLDANVAGSPTALVNNSVATTPLPTYTNAPPTSTSLAFTGKSYLSFADLMQIPGFAGGGATAQAAVNKFVTWRNAGGIATANSAYGNTYLGAIYNYASSGFLNFQLGDSPLMGRQDLINYFTNLGGTYSSALPYLGTFSRAVSAPSVFPQLDSSAMPGYSSTLPGGGASTPVTYHASMENTGVTNRDLANVRSSTGATVTHYYDDPTSASPTASYSLKVGDPLLQSRFSLAKLNWLSQPWAGQLDPGTTSPTYATSAYPAAIQACFGLVWGTPGSTTTNSSRSITIPANGGNPCWNYVGSTGSTLQGTIETLDQVAAEGREPNFFELLKAAILSGSIGLGPGRCAFNNGQNYSTQPSSNPSQYNYSAMSSKADWYGVAGLYSYSFDGHSSAGSPKVFAPATIPDIQIIQIGANIIDQYDADSYPTAIYFRYLVGAAQLVYDPVSGGVTANPIFGPVDMVYGDENLPALNRMMVISCSPNRSGSTATADDDGDNATTTMASWYQPELWNPHQLPGTLPASASVPQSFQIQAYGGAVATWSWTGIAAGKSSINVFSSTSSPYQALAAGIITLNNKSPATSSVIQSLYAHPFLLTVDNNPDIVAGSPAAINIAQPNYPYYTVPDPQTASYKYTNHFVAFCAGVTTTADSPAFRVPTFTPTPSAYPNNKNATVGLCPQDNGGFGQVNSFALGWVDSSANFHPYSFLTGLFGPGFFEYLYSNQTTVGTDDDTRVGTVLPNEGIKTSAVPPDAWSLIDPRTGRFSMNFKPFGQNNAGYNLPNNTAFPKQTSVWGFAFTPQSSQFNADAATTPPFIAGEGYPGYPQLWNINSASFTQNTTATGNAASWILTPSTLARSYYYADLDGVIRPGDGIFSTAGTGDGTMLFGSAGTGGTARGDTTTGTSADDMPATATNNSGNARHGRRPIILNRAFRSVGELGYTFRDLPFKTLDFFTTASADSALLDVFSLTDEAKVSDSQLNAVVAGQVNLNNAPVPVIQAILTGGSKKDLDATYNLSTARATAIAQNIANQVNGPTGTNPLMNRADLVGKLGSIPATGIGPIRQALATAPSPDLSNKAYLEAPMRALVDVANTRTWNLLIDIIAQSGQMSPTATTLNDFIVQGERRYWLHIAIDRYTGKIVDQQLEPVYE